MPEHQRPTSADALSDLVRRVNYLEAQTRDLLAGRRLQALRRASHEDLPAPAEGTMVIEAEDDSLWYFSNSEWREVGGGDEGTAAGLALAVRYAAFYTRIDPWPTSSWTSLDFSERTIVRTNDVDGTEDEFNSADGPFSFVGENFAYDTSDGPTEISVDEGLYFVQYGVDLLGSSGEFVVAFGDMPGRSFLFDGYPIDQVPFSSAVAGAGGAGRASAGVHRTAYFTTAGTASMSVWQNSGATIPTLATAWLTFAKLQIVATSS